MGPASRRHRAPCRACLCTRERLHRGRGADAHRRHVRSRNRAADRSGQHHAAIATRSLTMPINILMPALSPTMEKGNLAKWLKKEGDKVKSGDVIAEIETDKATMEVEAVDEGTIAKILVPEGTQDVAVNDVIAVLAGDGADGSVTCATRRCCEAGADTGTRCGSCGKGRSSRASGGGTGVAGQRPCPDFLVAAGATPGKGSRH